MNVWIQAKILAYDQTRTYDDMEVQKALAGVSTKKKSSPPMPNRRRKKR